MHTSERRVIYMDIMLYNTRMGRRDGRYVLVIDDRCYNSSHLSRSIRHSLPIVIANLCSFQTQ
jgi:hypothetical protein